MRIAREANMPICHFEHPKALARFASIVAAVEREKCAEICEQEAKRCEEWGTGLQILSADRCAVAIRKRNEK